jgi:asparagine synthase (glutamine-hydrolysing)
MCGIFGQFVWQGAPPEPGLLWAATQRLAHRGPDGGAFWADASFFLGHRRLSIIDLATGDQPMANADASLVVAFNGEIYNFIELRAELESQGARFRTRSDTEILLAGYRQWGTGLPARLRGMFAFAIADRRDGSLFVARDRFGEKPLMLHESAGRITFASELGPLADLISADARAIDQQALGRYLCLNYVPEEATLMRAVRRLRPGTWRLYRRNGIQDGAFWTPAGDATAAAAQRLHTMPKAAAAVAAEIDRSVEIALRSDVPIALFLSGGIDSSLVAESAVRQGRLTTAYCVAFDDPGYSEIVGARRVAEQLGVRLEQVSATAALLDDFARIVAHADDPLADSSAMPMWALSKAVAKDFKVAISGDGGDELFGGYLTQRATLIHRRFVAPLPMFVRYAMAWLGDVLPVSGGKVSPSYKLRRFLRAAPLASGAAHFSWNGAWMPQAAADLLEEGTARSAALDAFGDLSVATGLDRYVDLSALQRADMSAYLANDILAKVDRMTMAHGLEARAPLLTPELAAIGQALPTELRATARGGKLVLRHLASERLGPAVGTAPKQGFSVPIHDWLAGPGRDLVMHTLSPVRIDAIGLMRRDAVLRVRDAHLARKAPLGFELWGLMVLAEWCAQQAGRQVLHAVDDATLAAHRVALPLAA